MPKFVTEEDAAEWIRLLHTTEPSHTFLFGAKKYLVHINAEDQSRFATQVLQIAA